MYRCPKLFRLNARTGVLIEETRQLFVSRMSSGIEQAMVYEREREGVTLRPVRHLVDITENDLDTEPQLPQVIRSKSQFPETPVQSARNSPPTGASPTRSSQRFMTTPNSPSQMSSSGVSRQMSPASSSVADQSQGRNILRGITPSIIFGPMVRIPKNVSTDVSRERKKSTTPTPTGSPLHSKSRPATPASGSGTTSPFFSPSLTPMHSSAGVATITRHRRKAPSGIILRGNSDPSRPSSASATGESTDDISVVTDLAKHGGLGSSQFAGSTSIEDDAGTGRHKAGTDVSKRTRNIGTGKFGAEAHEWEAVSTGSSIPPGHPKQMYKHKSFHRDRPYRSESNSPPNEGAEFPGFRTPVPKGTSVANMLGDLPSPGSAIDQTQSDKVLGTHDDLNNSYPRWPTYRKGSTEVSKEGPKRDFEDTSSSHPPPYKNNDLTPHNDIILEWRQFQQEQRKMKSKDNKYTAEVLAEEEEDKAEEDISEASTLNKANVFSAYDKNVKRHHTDKPTVLGTSSSEDYSKHALYRLFEQESSEESHTDMADTLASGSFTATKDLSVQVDLPDEKDSILTDLPGDIDMPMEADEPEEDTSSTVLFTSTTDPSGEVFEEGTTMLSQSSTKTSNVSTGNDESIQAAPPRMKDESATQKNEDQPPSKDTDITTSKSYVSPPSEPPRSSQPSSDDNSRKKD